MHRSPWFVKKLHLLKVLTKISERFEIVGVEGYAWSILEFGGYFMENS